MKPALRPLANPMNKLLLAIALILSAPLPRVWAQGCIASPNNPGSHIVPGEFTNTMTGEHRWSGSVSYRWFESDRMFGGRSGGVFIDGDQENTDRERNNQQTINTVNLFDVSATYGFTHRWSGTLTLPFISANRSSVFEHTDGQRHSMHSGGLGDVRLTTDYWLLDPNKHMQGNIALG